MAGGTGGHEALEGTRPGFIPLRARVSPEGSPRSAEPWTNGINEAGKMALLAWEKETGIELVQINGQRRYGGPPPGWVGGPPPAGTEVYIARLPQDVYENTLIPLFESAGRLYEFRLMMTFSGLNRGFAYARYGSRQDAQSAIAAFHRFQLRQGCAIVVCWSTQKRELVVNGLGAWVSQQELEATLHEVTEGICRVTLHASPSHKQAKLAVLKYRSHEAAALAKKALMEERAGVPEHAVLEASPEDTPVHDQACPGEPQRVAAALVPGGDPGVPCAHQWLHVDLTRQAGPERARGGQGGGSPARPPAARVPAEVGWLCHSHD
ncbi:dead end protein homolog 1 isoform X4 [Passer montanus]|uniref:dead end protein homolog 1 isoform X4 n=1 Tax=Passer montanus TaxID=9160 RepID=UPI0019616181|nr:dead end protein homolog 1 isoform X4 [Passer montanus]